MNLIVSIPRAAAGQLGMRQAVLEGTKL